MSQKMTAEETRSNQVGKSLSACQFSQCLSPNKTPGLAARLAIQELKPPYG